MTTTKTQNAANNPKLARIKKLFHSAIYRETRAVWNLSGEADARAYVGQFFNDECREERLNGLFA